MTDAGERWYVVQSQPNAELKAMEHLNRQGFATYLPRYVKRRRHARRVEHVPVPLFPRYLFVGIDMTTQRWRSIVSAPQAVPDQIVASLRACEDGVRLDLRPSFHSGDKIRVLDGALAGCFGLYEGMKDSERVAVLLDLLGRKVRVIVDAESIEAA